MLTIGLTGGIGSGKSTVAKLFQQLDVPVIDSDEIAREVVSPGSSILAEISKHFGTNIIDAQGQLKRSDLRKLIFANDKERIWLEQQLHPAIYDRIKDAIKLLKSPYCIVIIPLLVETNPGKLIDRILVIDSPEELQIQRAHQRDATSKEDILAIMQSQVNRTERLAAADDIIDNSGDFHSLIKHVNNLHLKYLNLSTEHK